jgi:hypothetical protein
MALCDNPKDGWIPLSRWCSKAGDVSEFLRSDPEFQALYPGIMYTQKRLQDPVPLANGIPVVSAVRLEKKTVDGDYSAYIQYVVPLIDELNAAIEKLRSLKEEYKKALEAFAYRNYLQGVEEVRLFWQRFPRNLPPIRIVQVAPVTDPRPVPRPPLPTAA